MTTVKATYLGGLRVECEHLQSGTKIVTDAPVDNHGKGEAFSPTDLCATSLAACMMTTMGIYAQTAGIDLTGTEIEITKKWLPNPIAALGKLKSFSTCPTVNIPTNTKRQSNGRRKVALCITV